MPPLDHQVHDAARCYKHGAELRRADNLDLLGEATPLTQEWTDGYLRDLHRCTDRWSGTRHVAGTWTSSASRPSTSVLRVIFMGSLLDIIHLSAWNCLPPLAFAT